MALMISNPLTNISSSLAGQSQGGLSHGRGRTWDVPVNNAQNVIPYSSSTGNSDLMQLFTDARFNSEQYNSAEAQKNRDWQEYMSNTSFQRSVADLKAAGLNPVLAATGGLGASTPAGSEAQLADNSASIMSLMGAMMSAGAVVGAAAISANSALTVANINAQKSLEGYGTSILRGIFGNGEDFGKSLSFGYDKGSGRTHY